MRVRYFGAAAVALAALAAVTPAQAQDAQPLTCVKAYSAASKLQAHLTSAAVDGRSYYSLGPFTENWSAIQAYAFDERQRDVVRKAEADSGEFLLGGSREREEGSALGDELFIEGASSDLNAILAPEAVLAGQRKLFAELRACDLAYGFTPVLGVPPSPAEVLALINANADRRAELRDQRFESLAALTDAQCAARFYLLGSVMEAGSESQQIMSKKMELAGRQGFVNMEGFTPERFRELIEREVQKRGSEIATAEDLDPLLEEVNACERRYGEPLTTRN